MLPKTGMKWICVLEIVTEKSAFKRLGYINDNPHLRLCNYFPHHNNHPTLEGNQMPTWQKVTILLVVLLYMIVNEGERIEDRVRIIKLEEYKANNNNRFAEHTHYYDWHKHKWMIKF